jgi:hypothetical protein
MTDQPAAEACFELIRRHRAERRPGEALALLDDLRRRDQSLFTQAQLGVLAAELGAPALAVEMLSSVLPHLDDLPNQEAIQRELARAELCAGRFEAGWSRLRRSRSPAFIQQMIRRFPAEAGAPLLAHIDRYVCTPDVAGRRLLVVWEGGAGDLFDMARYAASLKAGGAAWVCLQAGAAARGVLAAVPGIDALVETYDLGHMLASGAIDGWTLLFSLRTMFQETPFHPAWPAPWLRPPDPPAPRLGARPRLGLVWKSASAASHEPYRSMRLAELEPLLASGRADLVSLQFGVPTAEEQALIARHGIEDRSAEIGDFSDLARLMAPCDGVITVDTAAAHLAGGMRLGLWLALSRHHDPRWASFERYTPLYPATRLYRQDRLGDWDPVVERMAADLAGRGFPGD